MSVFGYLLVGFALGGVLGAVIGWLMGSRRVTAAETELKLLKEQLANERQQIDKLQERFRKEFEAISNKLLVDNSNSFNRQSTDSLEKLLSPLKEKLGEFKASLDKTHDATTVNNALLKDQVSQIGMEAARLSKALKGDAKVLGNWGENMLDKILEKSGLQRDVHYRRQQSVKGEDGDQRYLDVVVELPDNKHLVIDSKVSLKCYEEHVNSVDDPVRLKHLEEHVACIRNHFRGLGAKRYQETHGINTPDFVLMYLPIEAAFFVALAHDPGLFSEALDRNVVLTTNSTLLATLRTVASVWKLADQQKHAMEIAKRGGQLYDKFYGFIQDLQKVGDALDRSQDAWDEATKKLYAGPGSLVRQAEMLKTLGAKTSKVLPSQLKAKVEPAEGAEEQVIPTLEPEASDPETSTAPDPSASN